MTRAKSTATDEVVLSETMISHIGIRAGDEIDVRLLPGGKVVISAVPTVSQAGTVDAFFGSLARPGQTVRTLQEIDDAARAGWAGEVSLNDRG